MRGVYGVHVRGICCECVMYDVLCALRLLCALCVCVVYVVCGMCALCMI